MQLKQLLLVEYQQEPIRKATTEGTTCQQTLQHFVRVTAPQIPDYILIDDEVGELIQFQLLIGNKTVIFIMVKYIYVINL